jgi:rhodanese-related sulfurtransferase
MRPGIVLLVLLLASPSWQASSPRIPESARDFLVQQGAEYRRARAEQDGLLRAPADLLERLLAGEPVIVVDVRDREEFERFHLDGARSVPLPDLLDSGGLADLPAAQEIWVVGAEGSEAVEAMVFLRVAGLPALAVTDGMEALRWLPGETAQVPVDSPLADERIQQDRDSIRELFAGEQTVPAAPPAPTPSPREEVPAGLLEVGGINPWIVGAVGVIAIAFIGTLLYFLVWVPRRKRRALGEALESLATEETEELERAEELLSRALTAGLKSAELSIARFALAYVRARLERYAEAAALVREIPDEYRTPEDVYLELWLEAKQDHHAEVVRLYDEHAEALNGLLDAKMITGLALFQEGRSHLARRETELALSIFQRLKKLDVLKGKLPSDMDDHQVLLGIQSLIDKNTDDAEKRFKGAEQVARDQGKSTVYPRLGLLLCRWRAEARPEIDDELGATLQQMEADLAPGPAGRNGSADAEERSPAGQPSDEERLLRDVRLWFAVSRLFLWLRLPEREGLPDEERLEVERRLAKTSEIDPEMGDVHLLAGLLEYYFAEDDQKRHAALERLEKALETDVNLPEVRYLVDRERKLAEAAANSLESYLKLVRDYLADDGVPLELRRRLKERLDRFRRFKEFGEADLQVGEGDYVPTLQDYQTRGALMRRRVRNIVEPRLKDPKQKDELEEIQKQIKQLEEHTDALAESAREVERSEQGLMVVTGEFLLEEDETPVAPVELASGSGKKAAP